ncbi:entericidin A/B family lipoprotein [Nitrincola tapanii]|uniref:Entericidin A/B family lipoprotein n=1 Tax=Nitrincola tapanii TaxID=1708751 RepID=A0A5A9W0Q8_9GAMM|nr:entericidin A/B family lipoprotein [Nitrincola tapanii]KAA0874297.1 entericidin A/B family lipoprotein [Nitrincola tapanii]
MRTLSKRLLFTLGLSLVLSLIAACNTIEGIGKDVQRGGEAIERIGKQ